MKTLALCLALTMPISLHAKIASYNTVNFNNQLTAEEPDFNNDLERVATQIDSWNLTPVAIHAIITPRGDNASFDYGTNIYIPRSMQFSNEYGADTVYKTTSDVISVFSHEYGHAVFDEYISRALPAHKQLKEIKGEISALDIKRIQSPLNSDELKKIAQLIKEKEETIKTNKEFIRVAVLGMPYSELFADVVAVFERDSKGAIFEALYNPNISRYQNPIAYEMVAARDFGVVHDAETWKWDEPHMLFSPLRSVIGSDKCWPPSEEDRAAKLKALAKILVTDIVEKNAARAKATVADNKPLMEKYEELCR